MIIGIRQENKGKWEQRAPLAPSHVRLLVDAGITIQVEKSSVRAYSEDAYRAAGATLVDTMQNADLILGVKEIPLDYIQPHKIYFFFSHTIKGQAHNMPLLQRLLEQKSILVDYEKIVNQEGRRLVFFGPFAGNAGMLDALYGLGQKWKLQGFQTPFADIKPTYHYKTLENARKHLAEIADRIGAGEMPAELGPLVFGFTGYGNVSLGAQAVFDILPHETISADQLAANANLVAGKIYKAVFTSSDMYARRDGQPFDKFEFFKQPELFASRMAEYLPHLTMLINAVYWSDKADRIVSRKNLQALALPLPFIADISCDINGGIEVTTRATTIESPFLNYSPATDTISETLAAEGTSVLAIDNLPCELSLDATDYFGNALAPLLLQIKSADQTDQWPAEISKAIICQNGELTEDYQYLNQFL
jgi:saccharopine dehydrogenase (NAD+, L-lysine-forming)